MTKKIISVALVVIMVFSLSVTAFAATTSEISAFALEAAQESFEKNGLSESQVNAAVVTSCELLVEGVVYTTYSVTVQSGLIYYYTCTVSVGNLTGYMFVENGLYATSENTLLTVVNSIYEFFSNFFTQMFTLIFNGFFE